MHNVTFASLAICSLLSASPMFVSQRKHNLQKISFDKSFFSNHFTNILYSNANNNHLVFHETKFANVLDSAIKFDGACKSVLWKNDLSFNGKPFKNINVSIDNFGYLGDNYGDKRAHFKCDSDGETMGDVTFTGCVFLYCKAGYSNGGAINIEQQCNVMIHNTLFIGCSTVKRGGALYIVKINNENEGDLQDEQLNKLDVQYCCFQDCYGYQNDELNYGIAMYSAAVQTTLFYASTVNCSDATLPRGAQFDLQANDISSKFINITGGKAKSCAGIEYRRANSGFFKYQTMAKTFCKWVTAFTNAEIQNLNLTLCNYISNQVYKNVHNDNEVNAGFVFIKKTDIIIDSFYFYNNSFTTGETNIVVRDKLEESQNKNIKLINCYMNNFVDSLLSKYTTTNCFFGEQYTDICEIEQLNLGGCQGVKTADILVISKLFTPSIVFTRSGMFSESSIFKETNDFSKSTFFTQSGHFSETDEFTKSTFFTQSGHFSETSDFTTSFFFSKSNNFIETDEFTKSTFFTQSGHFSETDEFSRSSFFSFSVYFSQSFAFTQSDDVFKSNKFTQSDKFSKTNGFSSTNDFTKSNDFSDSHKFSSSHKFPSTLEFSSSFHFSNSNKFSETVYFSESSKFSDSLAFTGSNNMVPPSSNEFSRSSTFTCSSSFSRSYFPINILINDQSNKNTKLNPGKVAGIVVAVAALAALIVAGFLFLRKRNAQADGPEIVETEIMGSNNEKFVFDNPILSIKTTEDDPFAEDFNEIAHVLKIE